MAVHSVSTSATPVLDPEIAAQVAAAASRSNHYYLTSTEDQPQRTSGSRYDKENGIFEETAGGMVAIYHYDRHSGDLQRYRLHGLNNRIVLRIDRCENRLEVNRNDNGRKESRVHVIPEGTTWTQDSVTLANMARSSTQIFNTCIVNPTTLNLVHYTRETKNAYLPGYGPAIKMETRIKGHIGLLTGIISTIWFHPKKSLMFKTVSGGPIPPITTTELVLNHQFA